MKNTLMRTSGLVATLIASSLLTACGTTGGLQSKPEPADRIGGNGFLVTHFTGLPARDGMPAIAAVPWTPTQFLDLKDLELMCHVQIDPQLPAAAEQIGSMSLKLGVPTGAGAAIGTGLGAIAAFTGVGFGTYAVYAGLSALGSGLGSGAGAGANQAQIAKNYAYYACQQWAVAYVQKEGRLTGIGIQPFAGVGQPKGVPMPTTAPRPNIRAIEKPTEKQLDDAEQDQAPLPPPT